MKLYYGASDIILEIKDIDEHLRDFILKLNNIPGVVTFGCCSGHPRWRSGCYIYFRPNGTTNLKKVLDFFNEIGFTVDYEHCQAETILSSVPTDESIKRFWEIIESKFWNYMGFEVGKVDVDTIESETLDIYT